MPRPALSFRFIRRLAAFAAACIAIIIAWLSLILGSDVPAPEVSDKIRHLAAYAALTAPLTLALHPRRWLLAALVGTVYGVAIEFAQAFGDAGREGSALDALANLAGALLGAGLIRLSAGVRN